MPDFFAYRQTIITNFKSDLSARTREKEAHFTSPRCPLQRPKLSRCAKDQWLFYNEIFHVKKRNITTLVRSAPIVLFNSNKDPYRLALVKIVEKMSKLCDMSG